jgi:hypothetical protein
MLIRQLKRSRRGNCEKVRLGIVMLLLTSYSYYSSQFVLLVSPIPSPCPRRGLGRGYTQRRSTIALVQE